MVLELSEGSTGDTPSSGMSGTSSGTKDQLTEMHHDTDMVRIIHMYVLKNMCLSTFQKQMMSNKMMELAPKAKNELLEQKIQQMPLVEKDAEFNYPIPGTNV